MKEINLLKEQILDTCYKTREGHVASSYSVLDILYVAYSGGINIAPDKTEEEDRDRFILSKGHAALGYYAILKHFGYFSDPLDSMCAFGSILGGHPDCNKINGVEASTGSLGHGVPMAVGMAWGLKIRGEVKPHVYVLLGDGELNEGSVWESFLLAEEHNLNNLTFIIDYNHSNDRAVNYRDLVAKMNSFGFKTVKINGHDHKEIKEALSLRSDKPVAVIAETVKGNGIKEIENNPAWHHRIPTDEEMKIFKEELL